MKSFIQHTSHSIQEKRDYYEALSLLENSELTENILSRLTSGVRAKLDFIKTLASSAGANIEDVVVLFKNSQVFKFFSALRFNLANLWKSIKAGYAAYAQIQRAVAEYISKTKIGKWTQEALSNLDNWLQKHPTVKRIGGFAVAGMLLYIWLNMSFTGDFSYDFDFADILSALSGKFALSTLFAGTDGTRMLLLFATGMMGLSFPWPGPTSAKLVISVLNGLRKLVRSR
jgi:hypothetical protein